MFIGHFGAALAAKKFAPKTSLGTLIFAAEFLDLLWSIFLLLGVEHVTTVPGITKASPLDFTDYPISHSLLMAMIWAVIVGAVYYGFRRYTRGAWVVAFAVLSHWVLDLLVHRPDLPLWPGGRARLGLGLWNSWPASITAEVLILGMGLWLYLSSTRAKDRVGHYGFWALILFLLFCWISTLFAGAPPNVRALAWGGMTMWLFVLWGWWADEHRATLTTADHAENSRS